MKRVRGTTEALLVIAFVTSISIALDIPILRQVFGFFFLTFIPGFVILRILNLKERNVTDTILFSVGLSIAFMMAIGLVMNELYPLFGVSKPLSTIPLTITIMCLTMILFFIGYRSDLAKIEIPDYLAYTAPKALVCKAAFLVLPLFLGTVGVLYNSAPILLLMIIVIVIVFALAVFSRKFLPIKLYSLAIFAIGMGLLLHTSLISKYNLGVDINLEYYVFKLTEAQGYWEKPGTVLFMTSIDNLQSVLSGTILPTIYSVLLNIDGVLIFKLIYAFLFSLVPLALYRIYEQQTGKLFAFLSAFLFMSMLYSFYGIEPLSLPRQILAILFLTLSVFLLVNKNIALRKRRILFLVFGACLVVSHYSLSYIYLVYIIFTFIISYIQGKTGLINAASVLFFSAITFSWFIYISNSPLLGLTNAISNIFTSFTTDLFNPTARSPQVFSILDPSTISNIVGLVHRLILYIQQLFIFIGIVMLIIKRKKTSFTREYQYMSILSIVILLLCFLIPNFAPTLRLERFYQITLLFLAPFFVFGGQTVFESAKKVLPFLSTKPRMSHYESHSPQVPRNLSLQLVTVVLIASFLFQVGFVNYVTGSAPLSNSLELNRKRTSKDLGVKIGLYWVYIPEQDVFSARWHLRNVNQTALVYADLRSEMSVLINYALLDRDSIQILSNTTVLEDGAYAYLRYLNVHENIILTEIGSLMNTSDLSFLQKESNKIYSNGGSEVYYAP